MSGEGPRFVYRKRQVLESAVEAGLVKRLNTLGVETLKLNVSGNTGWPDRIVMLPGGTPLFVETKRPKEKLRKKQEHIHNMLIKLGYSVLTARDKTECDVLVQLIERFLEEHYKK